RDRRTVRALRRRRRRVRDPRPRRKCRRGRAARVVPRASRAVQGSDARPLPRRVSADADDARGEGRAESASAADPRRSSAMNRPARAAAATTTEIVPVALARRPRMKESIVDQLRRLILEGKLAPGTVLRQEQLAKQLQVSRTPLREALISLEREGFIVVSPSGAASVVARDAREILDVREVIDGLAARLLARRGLDAQTERRLAELEGEMESTAPSDKHRYLVANGDFHVTIVEATGHERLRQFVALVRMSSDVVYMRLQNQGRRLSRSAGEHGAILDAIRARDQERAERLAREHVRNAAKHWLREET